MFDTLTPAERDELGHKLAVWAREFAGVAHTLARTSLATEDPRDDGPMWTQSERFYEVMSELHELRDDALAA